MNSYPQTDTNMPSQTPINENQAPTFASLSRSSIRPSIDSPHLAPPGNNVAMTDYPQTDSTMPRQTPGNVKQAPTFASLSRSSIQPFTDNHPRPIAHDQTSELRATSEKQAPTFASLSRSSIQPYTDNHPRPIAHDPSSELRAASAREVHARGDRLTQPPNPNGGLRTVTQTQASPLTTDPAPHRPMQARTAEFNPPTLREIQDNALAEPVNGTGGLQAPANHLSPSIPQQRPVNSTTGDSDATDALNDRDQQASTTEPEAQRRIQDPQPWHQTPAQEPELPRQAPLVYERPAPNQAPELWPQVAYPVFPAAVGIPANTHDMGTGDSGAAGFMDRETRSRAVWGANGTPAVAAERGSLREVRRRRVEGDEGGF